MTRIQRSAARPGWPDSDGLTVARRADDGREGLRSTRANPVAVSAFEAGLDGPTPHQVKE
jgi:hypothetical protein